MEGQPMVNFKSKMELQSPTGPVLAVAAGLATFLALAYLLAV